MQFNDKFLAVKFGAKHSTYLLPALLHNQHEIKKLSNPDASIFCSKLRQTEALSRKIWLEDHISPNSFN